MADARLAISYRTRRALGENGELPLGAAHYSYAVVKAKFCDCLTRHGHAFREIDRPEIYPRRRSRLTDVVHLQFKPFEEIRLLRGAPNIAHVAWEFDRLPLGADFPVGDIRRATPLGDAAFMLGLVDEIWAGSRFTRNVFAAAGLPNCEVIPAPIAAPAHFRSRWIASSSRPHDAEGGFDPSPLRAVEASPLSRQTLRAWSRSARSPQAGPLADLLSARDRVFLMVANVSDLRKNLPAALLGFSQASRERRACLVLKLSVEEASEAATWFAYLQLSLRFAELELFLDDQEFPDVLVVIDRLTPDEMGALYDSAHFYLCCAFAEGQNLPLLEAMARGVAPVSVAHTAMADYIDDRDAFVISHRRAPAPQVFSSAYGLDRLEVDSVEVADVQSQVEKALAASPDEVLEKARTAYEIVRDAYSPEAIYPILAARLAALAA